MKLINNTVIFSEFETVSYDDLKNQFSSIINEEGSIENVLFDFKNQIQNVNSKFKSEVIKLYWNKLTTTQYVGFIKLRKFNIQIIPKIYESDDNKNLEFLTYMIEYLNKQIIAIKESDVGYLSSIKGNLFEYFFPIFFIFNNTNSFSKTLLRYSNSHYL